MKKSNYVHALLWVSAVVGSFYLETFWYAKIRYIREVSFFDYRLTLIAVSMLIFTISMLLIYKIQERKSKKNMSKEKQIEVITYEQDRLYFFVDQVSLAQKKYDRLFKTFKDAPYLSEGAQFLSDAGRELQFYKDVVEMLDKGYRKQSEWISVEERLPELYTYVITYDTVSGDVQIDSVLSNGEFVIGYNVTHWMPLPEAPKGGEE